MSSVVDPITGVNTAIITRFYETFFFLGFLAVDGHHWVLRALDASFERAPVGVMELGADVTDTVLQIFGQMFAAGLTFAAPVMIVLALVSLLMGLLARAVPQLNILEVGFTLRIGVGFLGLFLFSPLITPALERIYALLMSGLDAAIDSIAP
jgi:flagellar biosynthetic protein FliR